MSISISITMVSISSVSVINVIATINPSLSGARALRGASIANENNCMLRSISLSTSSLLTLLGSNSPGNPHAGLGIQSLRIEIMLESNPLKSTMSVGRMGEVCTQRESQLNGVRLWNTLSTISSISTVSVSTSIRPWCS